MDTNAARQVNRLNAGGHSTPDELNQAARTTLAKSNCTHPIEDEDYYDLHNSVENLDACTPRASQFRVDPLISRYATTPMPGGWLW